MQRKVNRVVIGTNLWISYLINNKLVHLEKIILNEQIVILFSKELYIEILEVSKRKKFAKYFNEEDVNNLVLLLQNFTELIILKSQVKISLDPCDDFLLSLCKDGNAKFLITGDQELLRMEKFGKTRIISLKEFYQFIRNN